MKMEIAGSIPKHLMEEMQKDKPSSDAKFWAKPGCKHCQGSGMVGTITRPAGENRITSPMLCNCASRRWQKWQEEWMDARKPAPKGNGKTKPEPTEKERLEAVMPRLERIDDKMHSLLSEVLGLSDRINSMPQHEVISDLEGQLTGEYNSVDQIHETLHTILDEQQACEKEADQLAKKAKELRRQATQWQQKYAEERAVLAGQRKKIDSLEQEKREVERDLHRASHTMKRKRREAEQKLEKMRGRRERILRENNLESRIGQNSIQLSDINEETPDEMIDNS